MFRPFSGILWELLSKEKYNSFLSFRHLNIYILNLPSHICDINRPGCIFLREYVPEVGHKKTEKCGRITACLYGIVPNYSTIIGIRMVT